jgi:diguanylate cyclase (GGDEF)-like protein
MSRSLFTFLANVTDSVLVVENDTLKTWVQEAAFFDWDDSLVIARPETREVVLNEPRDGFTFVSPIFVRGDTLGFAQVRMDPRVLDKAIGDALKTILPVICGIVAISILLSFLLSSVFTSPVSKLKNQAISLAKGDLAARVNIRSRDELGLLGRVFNDMARNLQLSYDELKEKLAEIKRLFKMATEDGLTGLYVKRYFLELLSVELRRSIRYDRPLSFLMCDIDHFKRVNDTFGHPAGDVVLSSVARRLAAATRDGIDAIGRYGGEEFAVMLPETDEQSALRVAERLRRAIESESISLKGVEGVSESQITVTISIGVTTTRYEISLEKLVSAADKALYLSKKNGRNLTTAFAVESL